MIDKFEELKGFIVSIGLMIIGIYARTSFGEKKYSTRQVFAMVLVGIAVGYILHYSKVSWVYLLIISLISGVVMPNIISVIIKAANKSENKAADKISDKIDKLT